MTPEQRLHAATKAVLTAQGYDLEWKPNARAQREAQTAASAALAAAGIDEMAAECERQKAEVVRLANLKNSLLGAPLKENEKLAATQAALAECYQEMARLAVNKAMDNGLNAHQAAAAFYEHSELGKRARALLGEEKAGEIAALRADRESEIARLQAENGKLIASLEEAVSVVQAAIVNARNRNEYPQIIANLERIEARASAAITMARGGQGKEEGERTI